MRTIPVLSLLAVLTIGCGDKKAPTDPPAAADCADAVPPSASIGFVLTPAGGPSVRFDLTEGTTSSTTYEAGDGRITYTRSTSGVVAGTDTMIVTLMLGLKGIATGGYAWESGATDRGNSIAILIDRGAVAGVYRGSSGTTILSVYENPGPALLMAGKFCGTLRDSLGRGIEVTGGRFTSGE